MKVILVGFGVVGQGLAEILRDEGPRLKQVYGFDAKIVGVATRTRGTLHAPDGLDLDALLAAAAKGDLRGYPGADRLLWNGETAGLIRHCEADVLVEASLSNFQTAQPALDYCRAAFESGKHVVLANKGPVALAYAELRERALLARKRLRFEGTVMAGTPSLQMALEGLAGCTIVRARGILNGTTNYILTQMESGLSYAAALKQAQDLGYAEADPTADVDGWDAAGKVLILAAALFGTGLTMDDLRVSGIAQISAEDVAAARAAGERWKLIATAETEGGSVQAVRLPLSDPLANVMGATNAVTLTTDLLGDVTLVGPGAGRKETGFALLADLLAIHRGES